MLLPSSWGGIRMENWRDIAKEHLVNLARWDKNKKVMVDNYFIKIDGLRQVAKALKPIKKLHQTPQQIDGGWMAKTTIEFEDGGYFEAWATSTNDNTKEMMQSYKLEMSCTRSEARALRSGLGIDMCSYEELGEQEPSAAPARNNSPVEPPAGNTPQGKVETEEEDIKTVVFGEMTPVKAATKKWPFSKNNLKGTALGIIYKQHPKEIEFLMEKSNKNKFEDLRKAVDILDSVSKTTWKQRLERVS